MLDIERLEIVMKKYKDKGFDPEVHIDPARIEVSLRKHCATRNKWYGMSRHLTWIELETASFEILEKTLENIETELVRDALLDSVPKYEDQVLRGRDVFRPMDFGGIVSAEEAQQRAERGPRPYHQGRYQHDFADK